MEPWHVFVGIALFVLIRYNLRLNRRAPLDFGLPPAQRRPRSDRDSIRPIR
jgi:hypothetical protein